MIILSRWIRNNPNRSWCHSILLCRLPNHSYYSQKLLQKQSSFGWRNLSHLVSTRVPKFIYGALIHIIYDSSNLYRFQNALTSASGARRLYESFGIILPKVSPLFPSFKSLIVFRRTFFCRISKFPRRRNSVNLNSGLQIVRLVYEFLSFLFGVSVNPK